MGLSRKDEKEEYLQVDYGLCKSLGLSEDDSLNAFASEMIVRYSNHTGKTYMLDATFLKLIHRAIAFETMATISGISL